MEALGTLFAGITGGGATAAAGTAATATTTSAASTGLLSSTNAGLLQGGLTALKVIGTIGAGISAAREAKQAANEADLQVGQEENAAKQRQTRIAREMARVLGQNDVSYAAAGIDLTQGIAQSQSTRIRQQAADDITIDQRDADFRKSMYRQRANAYRAKARSSIGGALIGALGDVGSYGLDLSERG